MRAQNLLFSSPTSTRTRGNHPKTSKHGVEGSIATVKSPLKKSLLYHCSAQPGFSPSPFAKGNKIYIHTLLPARLLGILDSLSRDGIHCEGCRVALGYKDSREGWDMGLEEELSLSGH